MTELAISKINKRAIFPHGSQKRFLLKAFSNLNLSYIQFANKIKVHPRTLNDWKREKYSIPVNILKKISNVAKVEIPKNIKIKDPFWYVYKGAKIGSKAGALACFKKYGSYGGDPEYRKKKWYEWWEREGKFKSKIIISKPVREPKYSQEVAEFTGIVMGDGGLTKNQLIITVNSRDDKEYAFFINKLINRNFGVPVSIYYRKGQLAMSLAVSRVRLVKFCKNKLGLKIGDKLKQGLDIPEWIKKNRTFKIACIRGLMDTDGCIFNECHIINKKKYCYPRMSFVSASIYLRVSVFNILKELGFTPKMRNNRSVQLENRKDIIEYFDLINTNNPKHRKRFELAFGGVGSGYPK